MSLRKRVLLKLTGELFIDKEHTQLSTTTVVDIIRQVKQLSTTYQFGIVVGGGNFFRGQKQSDALGIEAKNGDYVGMLATMMNGIILQDLCKHHNLSTVLFTALECPEIGKALSPQNIETALQTKDCLIFTGGTGLPFFTTDTNAVLRSLQIGAHEIWKGTDVNGVYDNDPHINANAHFIESLSYQEALEKQLSIMDATAFTLAAHHKQTIRVFNIFTENALINAAHNKYFGSTIQPKQGQYNDKTNLNRERTKTI